MGFRFRRSMSIIPGVRLNFGKRGVSMSVGPRGAKITMGTSGTRVTAGIPGTGLSYTEKLGGAHASHDIGNETAPADQAAPYSGAATRTTGFAALGWVVAAILLVLLIAALAI
jgi:hypothetical protein